MGINNGYFTDIGTIWNTCSDDDSIWIVVDVRRFFKSENKVNAVRIRDMNSPREIWYPSRHIEVIG